MNEHPALSLMRQHVLNPNFDPELYNSEEEEAPSAESIALASFLDVTRMTLGRLRTGDAKRKVMRHMGKPQTIEQIAAAIDRKTEPTLERMNPLKDAGYAEQTADGRWKLTLRGHIHGRMTYAAAKIYIEIMEGPAAGIDRETLIHTQDGTRIAKSKAEGLQWLIDEGYVLTDDTHVFLAAHLPGEEPKTQ